MLIDIVKLNKDSPREDIFTAGEGLVGVKNQCGKCIHIIDGVSCGAFPNGIPAVILLGIYDHSIEYIDEERDIYDNGIRFEPRKE